ncbi:site-specific integrase [Methylobacterium oryzae]|uniref:Tyr recombinase domain-containing protein n=1 Tax=Methylobacterium oryzae TaxID=334852 RepID=A0ABU7TXH6_9HYPH
MSAVLRLLKIAPAPSSEAIIDLSGLPVDTSTDLWNLNYAGDKISLNFAHLPFRAEDLLSATKSYMRALIKSKAPKSVYNTFAALRLLSQSELFVEAERNGTEIPESFIAELQAKLGSKAYQLHHIRHWYRSGADRGYASFSPEVAFQLDQKVIGGNAKGHAVLSLDPEDGPLVDLEITALLNALNAQRRKNSLPLDCSAALWLCVALGCNPFQMTLLRERDIEIISEGNNRFINLRVPRVKKRHDAPRTAFKTRKLTSEIGDVVLNLIAENRQREALQGRTTGPDTPIFLRRTMRSHLEETMADYAWHMYPSEFTALVGDGVSRLGVISARTGEPLKVTTRRLRYTFATRLVREGASMEEVAEALDHTDLQNVRVYFDIKSDIVKSLDRAMALKLGPVAQAFLGNVVPNEADAERGGDPASRVMAVDRATGRPAGLGTCGEHSYCNLLAPIACYTCGQFQPWMDGPHDKILDDLIAQRERKQAAGMDGRMVTIHDATILAIGDVIRRIEEARAI